MIRTSLFGEVESSPSPIRRQAPDIKYPEKGERRPDRMAAVRYLDKVERWPNRMAAVRHPGGVSDDFRPDGMNYAMHRKGVVFVAMGKEVTRHFLGRIP